ncbi:MAG: Gfo/Idh/MocA family oxidoreductase [Candidatus Latescibacteria bacterium]|jgi:predicted dehydrogenase|nr:Gfo/Idh/MocA family oxidoreductase [Candidatus Latescibacterota bacterium]
MKPLRVGVIGAGGHARLHFDMFAKEPEIELAAIAELDPERLERALETHGAEKGYGDYREMLDSCELDIVEVLTMPAHLTPIVVECLERGFHTVIEKPVGMSSADAETMLEASKGCSGLHMVSVNRRYVPEVLATKRLVLERGGTVQVAAVYNKPVTTIGTSKLPVTPVPIICDAIHHVDLIRWMSGPSMETAAVPTYVYADAWSGEREGSFRYNAIIGMDTGGRGTMMSHYGVGGRIQRAEVHGEDFSAYLDLSAEPKVELYVDNALVEEPLDVEAVGGAEYNETRHFVDCIRQGTKPWSTLDDLVITTRLSEAIAGGTKGEVQA